MKAARPVMAGAPKDAMAHAARAVAKRADAVDAQDAATAATAQTAVIAHHKDIPRPLAPTRQH